MIDIIPGVSTSASALTAERIRMDVISQNVANANTTRTPSGQPYQRQQVTFENVLRQQDQADGASGSQPQMVKVARIQSDSRPPRMIYSPAIRMPTRKEWWPPRTSTFTRKWLT